MKRCITIFTSLLLLSCDSTLPRSELQPVQMPFGLVYPSAETKKQSDLRLAAELEGNRRSRESYARKNAAYRLHYVSLPATKSVQLPLTDNYSIDASKLRPVSLEKGLSLQMKLGKHIPLKINSYTFRTHTRYVLTVSGRAAGSAESLITQDEDGDGGGQSRFLYNETTREILIEEKIGGAGAQHRHIAFLPVGSDAMNKDRLPSDWRLVYVQLPGYAVMGNEGEIIGTVHGIQDCRIIVETDGEFYAYPVDEFVLKSLECTVG